VQQKLAAVKQSVAENQKKLHQYQWMETDQLTLKGDPKPPSQSRCQYGPDGKVQKTPMGEQPAAPSGGRMKQKVIANKKDEMKDYMGQVKGLLAKYVPPDPQSMQQAYQSGKGSLIPNASAGVTHIAFKDYALTGDQMTISFDRSCIVAHGTGIPLWGATGARRVIEENRDDHALAASPLGPLQARRHRALLRRQ
jgi:hypothetical protein